jgi:hypothetical protein
MGSSSNITLRTNFEDFFAERNLTASKIGLTVDSNGFTPMRPVRGLESPENRVRRSLNPKELQN